MTFDVGQLLAFVPLLILVVMGCVILVAETFIARDQRAGLAWIGAASCVAALAALASQWGDAEKAASFFQGMLVVDRTALFFDATFLVSALLTFLIAQPYLRAQEFEFGEFYALVLFTTAGMMMVAHADHMLTLLLGIETMSLGAYVLTGSWRRSLRSSEAAMKYFLMGAFATGFLVYGIALVYGATGGQFSLVGIGAKAAKAVEGPQAPVFLLGEYMILVALAFKIAAVPFHMWTPDAYEGAPTPVTGFMAAGVKAAAFAALLRVLQTAFAAPALIADATGGWVSILAVLALLTMTIGNLGALGQENIKRLLAYSSIAHAGYVLIGVVAMGLGSPDAKPAILFYLLAYTFTTLGTFGVVAWIGNRKDERLFVDDWAGLGAARPAVALAMTVFLLSLGGVPPTGGFFGKLYVFRAAMQHPHLYWLVVAGVLNSVISVYYYLRVIVAMYFRAPLRPLAPSDAPSTRAALFIAAVAVVLLGLLPGTMVEWAGGTLAGK